FAMRQSLRACCYDQTAIWGTRKGRDGALDLTRIAQADWCHFQPDRRRHRLNYSELSNPGGYVGISKDCRACNARRDLLERFHPFPTQTIFKLNKAGDVAARPRHGLDEASADRVCNAYEHNWHATRCLQ